MTTAPRTPAPRETRTGTQTIEKTFRIVREVAAHFHFGARLTDVAERCGYDKSTTQRILAALVRERVLEQRSGDRRYLPGPLLFELGLTVPSYRALEDACRVPLKNTARRCKGAAFVYLRSGDEAVCLARVDHVPVQGAWPQPGTRRALASLAAGLAILVEMPGDEADACIAAYLEDLRRNREPLLEERQRMVKQSQRLGYGINTGRVAHGLASIAVAIRDANGQPFASVSIVSAFGPHTVAERDVMVSSLRADAAQIEETARRLMAGAERGLAAAVAR